MSNDNKTLADAQPGGRVRLGDRALSTSEGARRYVANVFATQLRRHDFGDYILTELAADFACALAQHLSAQPSPGGQDAAIEAMAESLLCAESSATLEDAREQAALLLADALPHLAARQPVGEPDAYLVLAVKDGETWEHRWYVPRWGDPDPSALEGTVYEIRGKKHPELGTYRVKPFYTAPPAQAVDLDAMHAAACAAWDKHQQACRITTVSGSLRKVCEALIDKAVGNG